MGSECCDGCGTDLSVQPVKRYIQAGGRAFTKRVRMRPAQAFVSCYPTGSRGMDPSFRSKVRGWVLRLCRPCIERYGMAAALAVALDKRQDGER